MPLRRELLPLLCVPTTTIRGSSILFCSEFWNIPLSKFPNCKTCEFVNIDVSGSIISVITCYKIECKAGTTNKLINYITLE